MAALSANIKPKVRPEYVVLPALVAELEVVQPRIYLEEEGLGARDMEHGVSVTKVLTQELADLTRISDDVTVAQNDPFARVVVEAVLGLYFSLLAQHLLRNHSCLGYRLLGRLA